MSQSFLIAVEENIPHEQVLRKHGRLGIFLADNRRRVVKVVCVAAIFLVGTAACFVLAFAMNMGAKAARGFDGQLPLTAPWTEREIVEKMLLAKESHAKRIGLFEVQNLIEPRERIDSPAQIAPLLAGMKAHRGATLDGSLPFASWKPFQISLSANFSLTYVEMLLRNAAKKRAEDCVCFVEYGLPYESAFVAQPFDRLLLNVNLRAPFSTETVHTPRECVFSRLIDAYESERQPATYDVRGEPLIGVVNATDPAFEHTSKSGNVCFTEMGAARVEKCEIVGVPVYQCLVHCRRLFERLARISEQQQQQQ